MVGGRVGRYLRVGVYTTFGLFFSSTYYIPIKSACILTHLWSFSIRPIKTSADRFSRPPAFPSWCRSHRCSPPPPPDCCDWQTPSPNWLGPGARTAWARPAWRGRGGTRTRLSIWTPPPEGQPLTLRSGQSESYPSVLTSFLCSERRTSWGAAWGPGGRGRGGWVDFLKMLFLKFRDFSVKGSIHLSLHYWYYKSVSKSIRIHRSSGS